MLLAQPVHGCLVAPKGWFGTGQPWAPGKGPAGIPVTDR